MSTIMASNGQPVKVGKSLVIKEFSISPRNSFLDYIFGGCEINVHVAIDYTMSNGPVNEVDSLHYLNP